MQIIKRITKRQEFYDGSAPCVALSTEAQEVRDDLNAAIESGKLGVEEAPCLCGNALFYLIADVDRYGVFQKTVMCSRCGLIQGMPRMNSNSNDWFYSSDTYRRLYDSDVFKQAPAEIMNAMSADAAVRFEFIQNYITKKAPVRIFELGCAGGWNLLPFHKAGHTVVGLDFGPTLISYGKELGMDLRAGSLDSFRPTETFDVALLSHVVEHFLDPVATVCRVRDHLTDGGILYIEVPNMDWFDMGQIQSAHTYYFTPRTLAYYMAQAGLRLVAMRKHITGSHLGAIFKKNGQHGIALDKREPGRMIRRIQNFELKQTIKRMLRIA
ncbi:class I SAM-dependent methyltransferase [Acidobacteria bacterium AH-259-O06]|nr:class I SAM-dependent methyltransferase [Acidobacteria bacterium AH-259-O06]